MTEQERKERNDLSNRQGRAFEARLDQSFRHYEQTGEAIVEKTPEPMKVIKPLGAGRFLACYTKSAQPDYKGVIRGGFEVMYEAKFTSHDRMEQARVTKEQTACLTRHQEMGARCYVLAGFQTGEVYRIPWPVWCEMKAWYGRKYVKESDIQDYKVQQSDNGILLILKGETDNG